jgi:hypothetical protein
MNHFMAPLIVLLGLVELALPLQAAAVKAQVSQAPLVTRIDGRVHPELVPPEIAWEHFFYDMASVGFIHPQDAEPSGEMITALSKYNLFISPANVRTVLLVAKATVARVDELRRSLDVADNATPLTTAQRQDTVQGITRAVLSGRDALVTTLPRQEMAALDKYVRTKVVPSIKLQRIVRN